MVFSVFFVFEVFIDKNEPNIEIPPSVAGLSKLLREVSLTSHVGTARFSVFSRRSRSSARWRSTSGASVRTGALGVESWTRSAGDISNGLYVLTPVGEGRVGALAD